MEFSGSEPVEPGGGFVEFHGTPLGYVDMYNYGSVRLVGTEPRNNSLELLIFSEGNPRVAERSEAGMLRWIFEGVAGFRRDGFGLEADADEFLGWNWTNGDAETAHIEVEFSNSLLTFTAKRCRLLLAT